MHQLVRLPDGATFHVRPMRPADGPAVVDGFRALSPADRRFRFFAPSTGLSGPQLAELAEFAPERQILLLAFDAGAGALAAGARAVLADDGRTADVAVTVREDLRGRGLGAALLRELRRAARAGGIEALRGYVLAENHAARALVRRAGGHLAFDEPGVLRFELPLATATSAVPAA